MRTISALLALVGHVANTTLTDPTLTVDSSYALAINVMGVPPGTAVTISWKRSDGVGPWVVQQFAPDSIIRLLRFTPKKEYRFYIQDDGGQRVGSQDFYTCIAGETGVEQYDADAPFVHFSARPSFEILVVDHGDGLVGFNAEGWVVWHLPHQFPRLTPPGTDVAIQDGPWDQFPAEMNYEIVALSGGDSLSDRGLEKLTPTARQVTIVSFSGLSHESRIDHVTKDVLSIGFEIRNISGLRNPLRGSFVAHWHRQKDTVSAIYNLFDYFDPVTDYGQCSGRKQSAACLPPSNNHASNFKSAASHVEDWAHGNSIERGTRDNYIMSVRHLSSVISFHADGSGIQWILSGEGVQASKAPEAPVLQYASQGQQQYMQHCARQLSNGNILLFDNGNLHQPPFTRFAEYEIDAEKGTAKLAWQFIPMHGNATSGQRMFAWHGGSVDRLANGNTVGTVSCDSTHVGVNCSHAIFEVDSKGTEVARTLVPMPTPQGVMGYRGRPLMTLGGERAAPAFDQIVV